MQMQKYDHVTIENTWQELWRSSKLNSIDLSSANKPFYNLMMFPYPSAEGLHVGNMYAFTGSDIYGRFKRMQGYDVFEPIGLDGFGIHSENYALKIGRHPMDHAKITEKNYYAQLHTIGAMIDWDRTVETYDPDYYRWTQWLFVQMFKHGLAYRGRASVNWCPGCKTVLADEQVIDARLPATDRRDGGQGKCERCGNIVEKRLLEQWFFRITAYAEKLLSNIPSLDWSEKVKVAQTNWIGKKEGINITYQIDGIDETVIVFTTAPVNFGMTFLVVAPEHELVNKIINGTLTVPKKNQIAISAYIETALTRTPQDRIDEGKEKTGAFTGLYAINRINGKKVPIWVTDFVLGSVGTGAVQGCPGHDRKDFQFAKKFGLPIVRVIVGEDGKTDEIIGENQVIEHGMKGHFINSDFLNGLSFEDGLQKTMDYFEAKSWGKRVTTYHLRDWLISRQRYWGPPIPMIYCKTCAKEGKSWFTTEEAKKYIDSIGGWPACQRLSAAMAGRYTVPEKDLPVLLPRIEDYKPGDDGIAPLAKHKDFYNVACPECGEAARRETDVSDTFLDSSWYFLRYPYVGFNSVVIPAKAGIQSLPWDPEITKKWLPVDMYTGGAEHSVLHLLYARFVWKALRDWGYLDFSAKGGPASGWEEPFAKFYAHGLVVKDGAKMSKSKGNVVNPDEYIRLYGSDALRLYLMFMGPFDQGGDFRDSSMEGMHRWVGRVWRMGQTSIQQSKSSSATITSALQKAIKRVGEDLEKRRYNTAIATMMEFTNLVGTGSDTSSGLTPNDLKLFLLLLAPFAPHITEELWKQVNAYKDYKVVQSVHVQPWPTYDESKIVDQDVMIAVQVNGRLRDTFPVSRELASIQSDIETEAKNRENVQKYLSGKTIRKVIFVPGKLINFVI